MTKKYRTNKSSKKNSRKQAKRTLKRTFFKRILRGGSDFGPATWNDSMRNPYTIYSKNDYIDDPSMPPLGSINTRNIGGSRKRQSKKRKSLRKIKGGSPVNSDSLGGGQPLSNIVPFSFGSSIAASSANILIGDRLPMTSEVNDNSNVVRSMV